MVFKKNGLLKDVIRKKSKLYYKLRYFFLYRVSCNKKTAMLMLRYYC